MGYLPIYLSVLYLSLVSCSQIIIEEEGLNDTRSITEVASDLRSQNCAACHAYPPTSGAHTRHLFQVESGHYATGQMTCVDCHVNSIHTIQASNQLGDPVDLPDLWHLKGSPVRNFTDVQAIVKEWFGVNRQHKDSIIPLLPSWLHQNGKVDVSFPRAVWGPHDGQYNKTTRACNACHGAEGEYVWP